jgi:hypothetical protein
MEDQITQFLIKIKRGKYPVHIPPAVIIFKKIYPQKIINKYITREKCEGQHCSPFSSFLAGPVSQQQKMMMADGGRWLTFSYP